MKAISFSIYSTGINHASSGIHYLTGIVRNAQLIAEIYPGWQMVVFCDPGVPRATVESLQQLGVDVRMTTGCSMFHRFLINDDLKVERYMVRDADSRLNKREAMAVAEWIESGLGFHVIRDHPQHNVPIIGALWGAKKGAVPSMATLMNGVNITTRVYNMDQLFLWSKVWPLVKGDCLQHDFCCRWPGSKPFSAKMGDFRFCGERFTEDDKPWKGDWERRINYMTP